MLDVRLSTQLDARRKELGWTVYAIARKSGYAENTVLRALHGRNVTVSTFQAIAIAMGLNLELTHRNE
jgi:transcriptional regulator with XRE-family HTH domain